jgi:hypothetical protein
MGKDQDKLPAGRIIIATDYSKLSLTCGSKKDDKNMQGPRI